MTYQILMKVFPQDLPLVLLDQQPSGIVYYQPLFDPANAERIVDFRLTYCNKQAARQVNATSEELTGNTILHSDFMDEPVKRLVLEQLTSVYLTGTPIEEEYFNKLVQRYFHVSRIKVKEGILTTAVDITESVELKREKDRQAQFTATILDNALNGWFYCEAVRDPQGNIEDFRFEMINPVFTEIVKKNQQQVLGRTHLELFPTARTNGIHELNCRVVNNKMIERKQMHYKGDHLDAWYDVIASPVGENGLLVTFADITQNKKKELEVANLAQTLTSVINTAQVGIFLLKPEYDTKGKVKDFRFTMVNPALSSYVAQEPETLIGALASEWFPGYLQNGVFDMYRDTFMEKQTSRKEFHYNVDGIDVYLDIQATRIGDEVLVTFADFTPLQLAQLELQKSIHELQRSNQNLEEFTRAASHDLKEPIRKIQIFSDRLKQTLSHTLDPDAKELFSRMENAAGRMRMLIDDLLEYSQVNTTTDLDEKIDLNEIVNQVISDLEVMIEETEAVIDYEDLPVLTGNRRQLQQLFLNLVNNSMKYRKPGMNPHIFIHASEVEGKQTGFNLPPTDQHRLFTRIDVSDNGIGFNENDAEKIFKVFTRLHNNKQYIGTGIGLAIASRVMENHSGYIFARGVKGQGATFTLLFPV